MAQLDKFKRRLIRSVARLHVDEKKPEKEVWEILNKEMGCDCEPLWDRMRALTVKKLSRLLVCDDLADNIASVARPSNTDMLMFDLVLAHDDDVDVIGRDVILEKAIDCKALEELLELVQEFSLEETPVGSLASTWAEAANYYETRGPRLTSPMLLQRRWYQLKQLTRYNFYKLWQSWRGNVRLWDKARRDCSITDLQVAVAERYPYVVTRPFQKWDQLVKAGLIVLPHHFERQHPDKSDSGASGNEQDLVLVEPQVETIDLDVDSDSDTERDSQHESKEACKQTSEGKTATVTEYNPNITIKTEPPDIDGLCNLKILETTHIPVEPLGNIRQDTIKTEDIDPRIASQNVLLKNISKCIESTDELIKQCDPQEDQSENVQNALNDVENQMESINQPRSSVEVDKDAPEPQNSKYNINEAIEGKAVDYFRNKIAKELSKAKDNEESTENTVQGNKLNDELNESNAPEDSIEDSLSPERVIAADDGRSSEEEELEDIIKQTADDFVNKSKQSRAESGPKTLTDFTVVDDGIDFVDDGIEYNEDDEDKKIDAAYYSSIGTGNKGNATSSIDLKLLMTPVIVTTRLEEMLTFKDQEFASVVDRSIIDFAELESKPKQDVKVPVEELQVKQEHKSDAYDSESYTSDSEEDFISDDQRVKSTSYLLQKPRSRNYNPIQLCKNPDFNTRLKRLTFGFLSSERNRQFLSACKPATVDLHKAFEDKLVNGILYLKRSVTTDFVKENSVQKEDQSVQTVSVVPSAMSVQSLIDRSKINFKPPATVSSIDLTYDDITERNKIINLPDITQVRRINQKLLTAEVPPIRVQSNVTSAVVPNCLEAQPVVTGNSTAGLGQVSDDSNIVILESSDTCPTGQVLGKNNSPLLSNLLVTYKPPSFPKSSVNKSSDLPTEESSLALKLDTAQKVPEKRLGIPLANPSKLPTNHDKPPRKVPTKPIYRPLSWRKPVVKTAPLDDFLITHDTLLKMLAKAKNLPECKYIPYHMGSKNTVNVSKKTQKVVKSTKRKQKVSDNQKSKHEETNTIKLNEGSKDTKSSEIRKTKPKVRSKKGTVKTICCWARAWISQGYIKHKTQILRLPKHMCPFSACNCCCKHELPLSVLKEIENNDPIVLSDEESDSKLISVSNIIECVVRQSTQVPVPKLRVFSTGKHTKNLTKDCSNITIGPTEVEQNTPLDSFVVSECNKIDTSLVHNTLQDVVIDDDSAPVADVLGEVSVVADDTVQNNSINAETITENPKGIFVIPEANMSKMNANNPKSNVVPSFQVVTTANQKISTQKHLNLSKTALNLISSSVSKKVYVRDIYSKPSQKPPSVSMSTQTMDVPLLQDLSIETEVKGIKKPDLVHQKRLVVDGTRPFTTPTTIVNQKKEQVIHLNASKLSLNNPLLLGKNKILLTTVKFPSNLESSEKEHKSNIIAPKVVPTFPLPEGVEIVLQQNGELACMVKPGVELDSTQISMLPSILEVVKQQINYRKPPVTSDVINLCDDENEEKNYVSETNQVSVLPSLVAQTQKVETSIEDTAKTETNQTENEENFQKIVNDPKLLMQKNTAIPEVCNDSKHAESEMENVRDNQKSNKEKINICQVQGGHILNSQICDNNPSKSEEKTDEGDKDTAKVQNENNKCEEDKLVNSTKTSTKTEADKKEDPVNSQRLASNRNLLSDLMEMSGISEEDIKTGPEANTYTLPVININPINISNEIYANRNDINDINQFSDLNPVTSVGQLKYACGQGGKFFKLDFNTGTLVPISVCIKKKGFYKLQNDTVELAVEENEFGDKIGIPADPKVVIPVEPNTGVHVTASRNEQRTELTERFGRNRKRRVFSKPIHILRHKRPRILRNQTQDKKKAFERSRKATEERIEAKIDLVDSDAPMEEEYLINSESDDECMLGTSNAPRDRIAYKVLPVRNTVTEISDDSSDDEPLALKSKRMRSSVSIPAQAVTETVNINEEHEVNLQRFLKKHVQNYNNAETEVKMPQTEPIDADSMELDTDMPTIAILEEPMPETEKGDSHESESSPEDSILGM